MTATTNGITRSSRPPPPLGVVVPARDPMLAIIDLDKKKAGMSTGLAFSTVAQVLFILGVGFATSWGLLSWTERMQTKIRAHLRAEYEIELKEEQPPPEPPKEEEKPEPAAPVQHVQNYVPPPPAPAAAAPVLTAKDDDVVDMTNTIVTGDGGGGGPVQMNNGLGSGAPSAVATGVPTGTGSATAPPIPAAPVPTSTVDRSRAAREVSGNWRWCPFPAEADMAQIDEARVTMEVTLRADGTPATARVIADPGNGFGRQAQSCAMRAKYAGALDRDGNPTPTTFRFNVTFSR